MSCNILVYVTDQVFDNYSPIGGSCKQIVVTTSIADAISFINEKSLKYEYNDFTYKWIYDNIGEQDFERIVDNIHQVVLKNS